jgi:NDP-sugar pyrophosphorylase family protein
MPTEPSELLYTSFFDLKDFPHKELFEAIVYPWEALSKLDEFFTHFSGKIEIKLPPGVYLENEEKISIGKGTTVEPGVFLQGPCLIGPNCQLRHGAYIRGGVIAGPGSVIGHATEVKHSIFLNGAHAAHFNYVGDSILGSAVNLGAGSKLANLRLDGREISIRFMGKKIPTGRKKLGAIIGDRAQIGCNAVLNPGTLIGKGAICYPCLNISGVIAPQKELKHDNTNHS